MSKPYGLKYIAERVGVSKSTVSRVLNNKLDKSFSVKEDIRQAILDVAQEVNYKPNIVALSLTKRQMDIIHIIGGHQALTELGNIYHTVVNSVTEVLDTTGKEFEVTVNMSNPHEDLSELPPWHIAGVIILQRTTERTMHEIELAGIPYVVVNGPAGPDGVAVVPDDVQGTRLAMNHLISLGHERIAYANAPGKYLAGTHSSLQDRQQTYLELMKKHKFKPWPGYDEPLDSADAFIQDQVIDAGATAILAYGHMGGLHLMQASHKLGIQVPSQLSLLCFCDAYANSVMSPGLSFIDLGSRQMGEQATELLLRLMNKGSRVVRRTIKIKEALTLRHSTAEPGPL